MFISPKNGLQLLLITTITNNILVIPSTFQRHHFKTKILIMQVQTVHHTSNSK